jgi:hypothetical protein
MKFEILLWIASLLALCSTVSATKNLKLRNHSKAQKLKVKNGSRKLGDSCDTDPDMDMLCIAGLECKFFDGKRKVCKEGRELMKKRKDGKVVAEAFKIRTKEEKKKQRKKGVKK